MHNDPRVEEILASYEYQPHFLIAIMQDIQAEYKYLSQENLEQVAEKLGLSIAKVYSVATFYENFSLEPKGKYIIKVCNGTACHVRKSAPIYDALREKLFKSFRFADHVTAQLFGVSNQRSELKLSEVPEQIHDFHRVIRMGIGHDAA